MNGDLHHIDDLFKSGIEGKEDNPSPAVWENIEKELDKKDSNPKFFLWWNTRKIAAAALIILGSAGLFAGGYFLRGLRMEDKETKLKPSETWPKSSQSVESILPGSRSGDENKNKLPSSLDQKILPPGQQSEASEQTSQLTLPAKDPVINTTATDNNNTDENANEPLNEKAISGNKYPVSSDRNNALNEAMQTNQSILEITDAKKVWENEFINSISAPRQMPASEKHLDVPRLAVPTVNTDKPVNVPVAIPVLNKRNAGVDLPRFALTPVLSWQFGSNRIVANNNYPDAGKMKTEIDRTESQPSMISGGLLADLKIAKNMTLQSGLIFTNRTIQIEPKYIMAERNPDGKVRYKFDCSAGTYFIKKSTYARPGDSALTQFSSNELNYMNIPLSLTYHFGRKKLHLFTTAGAGLSILTEQYLETGLYNYSYDEHESISTNLKSNYFSGMIGAGINWQAFRKISFLFNPQYQFAITPMNDNMSIKAYPRTFNMQLGIQIRL